MGWRALPGSRACRDALGQQARHETAHLSSGLSLVDVREKAWIKCCREQAISNEKNRIALRGSKQLLCHSSAVVRLVELLKKTATWA